MSPDIPTVGDYTTPGAYLALSHEKVGRAKTVMRERGIRHLPVMEDGKLVGIVSDRDLADVHSSRPGGAIVGEAMTGKLYTVASNALLNVVAREMAKRQFGSAVVIDRNGVVGVFTTTDAMEALADTLEGKVGRRGTESIAAKPAARTRRAKVSTRKPRGRPVTRAGRRGVKASSSRV